MCEREYSLWLIICGGFPVPSVVAIYPSSFEEFALLYEGRTWSSDGREVELSLEANLERAGIRGEGPRFDRTGGGARTYRAWFRSLGLFIRIKTKCVI